jgi:hypothetical protein
MSDGELFVGLSRAGRVFVCSDWRKALQDLSNLATHSSIIECESDGSGFDRGGWLSVRDHRLLFEIQDHAYVVALDYNNRLQDLDHPERGSFAILTNSAPQLAVPVSYMALCDDAIMTTYTVRPLLSYPIPPVKRLWFNSSNCRPLVGVNRPPIFPAVTRYRDARTRLGYFPPKLSVS